MMTTLSRYISSDLSLSQSNIRISLLPVDVIPEHSSVVFRESVVLGTGAAERQYIFVLQYRHGTTEWEDSDGNILRLPAATVTLQLTTGIASWLLARMFHNLPYAPVFVGNLAAETARDSFREAIASGEISVSGTGTLAGSLPLLHNWNPNLPKYVALVEVGSGRNAIGYLTDGAVQHYYDRYAVDADARLDAEADGLILRDDRILRALATWADAFASRTAYIGKYFPADVYDFNIEFAQPNADNINNLFTTAGFVAKANGTTIVHTPSDDEVDPRILFMRVLDAFTRPYGPLDMGHYVPHNVSGFFCDASELAGSRLGSATGIDFTYTELPPDMEVQTDSAFLRFANARDGYFRKVGRGHEFTPTMYCFADGDRSDIPKNSPLAQALAACAPQDAGIWSVFILACEHAFDAWWDSVMPSSDSSINLTPLVDEIDRQTDAVKATIQDASGSLLAAIAAIDFNQAPTMGLANLIQSQNRVTQALVLALLRKSSSRAWFTSLIDKIGDANALLIDDSEIASIAEKAYQGDAVSNDEIHATPREAYKELFNDRGVKNV